mmetsp:Transcript_50294/g.143791  ORF Transcript_50294/g.143791 Transcript_50294/m.143791 type:complete len:103 (+) Transcript_50294:81-389(+)
MPLLAPLLAALLLWALPPAAGASAHGAYERVDEDLDIMSLIDDDLEAVSMRQKDKRLQDAPISSGGACGSPGCSSKEELVLLQVDAKYKLSQPVGAPGLRPW